MTKTILICEDETLERKMVGIMLTKMGYKILEANGGAETSKLLENSAASEISAVILDVGLPDMDGFAVLEHIKRYRPNLPVIILSGQDDKDIIIRAIKAGASDYIAKPPNSDRLQSAINKAIQIPEVAAREIKTTVKEQTTGFNTLIGCNQGLAAAVAYGRKAARSDIAVLITGEMGTGKEMFGRAIHIDSKRSQAAFISVNCSLIPEQTIERILIGEEKGGFVGVSAQSAGEYKEAKRGTLFFDDIHLLSPDSQVKLLRFLHDREVVPVGSLNPVKVNVRLISSTDRDLKEEVRAGRFREDLYFRLNVLTIDLPPLRQRRDDIPLLIDGFIQRICATDGIPVKPLSNDAKNYMFNYSWPGNVRELESLIHRALVLCDSDIIDEKFLKEIHTAIQLASKPMVNSKSLELKQADGQLKTMEQIEHEAWQSALSNYQSSMDTAAKALNNNSDKNLN